MLVHLANYDPGKIGGGWTFFDNFARGMSDSLGSYEESDIYFVAGPTLASRGDVLKAKEDGKKVVLRVDNAVRHSRNRGTGMPRLRDFSEWADLVIYQSKWARDFLYPFTQRDGPVILNGVDTEVYKPGLANPPVDSYLYVRSSRDEGKQWIMAWYWFVNNPGKLTIIGRFGPENLEYGFDFYNDEKIIYLGESKNMVQHYQANKYFLYTYLNDACSNTLLEAIACGCEIVDVYGMLKTGGAPEIMSCKDISLGRMIDEYRTELERL